MIFEASFFWRNDRPDGIGLTFGSPGYTPGVLQEMLAGVILKVYPRDSGEPLGTKVVGDYMAQLRSIGMRKATGKEISTKRGFLPPSTSSG